MCQDKKSTNIILHFILHLQDVRVVS